MICCFRTRQSQRCELKTGSSLVSISPHSIPARLGALRRPIQEDIRAGARPGEGTPRSSSTEDFFMKPPFEDVAAIIDEELKRKIEDTIATDFTDFQEGLLILQSVKSVALCFCSVVTARRRARARFRMTISVGRPVLSGTTAPAVHNLGFLLFLEHGYPIT